jgi:hypothetical protein
MQYLQSIQQYNTEMQATIWTLDKKLYLAIHQNFKMEEWSVDASAAKNKQETKTCHTVA